MKVILTGATGFIGGEVLKQLVQDPSITDVLVLSRRELPDGKGDNEKVKTIIHKDFSEYPDSIVEQLKGADACIWWAGPLRGLKSPLCLGGPYFFWQDTTQYIKTNVEYTLAAAKVFATRFTPEKESNKKFRFVFCSGTGSVVDQSKKLWFMDLTRKTKGQNEGGLFELAESEPKFDPYTVRPGNVMPAQPNILHSASSYAFPSVGVDRLAARMLELCKNGSDKRIYENDEIPI
ncbi:MAG: hypothetical protein M4579_000905 [Chaenotheca gracillima]|nr:MAG: hypothetical protein M4579_000905 [Chaenotheca gracillima]